jgi:hypothetical protein
MSNKFFKLKYRIVEDLFLGYEVQCRFWFFPFWFSPCINTHMSIRQAQEFIEILEKN